MAEAISWRPSPYGCWNAFTQAGGSAFGFVQRKAKQGLDLGQRIGTSVASIFKRRESGIDTDPRARRLELFRQCPAIGEKGDYTKGEIELVTDPAEIAKIEHAVKDRLLSRGFADQAGSRSGVLAEDPFFILIRDPVIFPNGQKGLYNRLLSTCTLHGTCGAVALPLTQEGKILLNLNFRHATRSWEFELPRGFARPGEPPLETVKRELKEETGMDCEPPVVLGPVAADTGALVAVAPAYLCRTMKQGERVRNNEAIFKCIPFSPQEVAEGLVNGYLIHNEKQIPIRDGFLTFALLQAYLRGYIKLDPVVKKTHGSCCKL